jgi:hypothetical protein
LSSRKYYPECQEEGTEISTTPTIRIIKSWKKLSVHPAEFYLGAETKDQELSIYVSWDGKVFEDELVEEWLDQESDSVLFMLDQNWHQATSSFHRFHLTSFFLV